jgi:type III secretory pathway component EscV
MEIFKPKQETGPETRRGADRANEGDRRRGGWRDFRRAYPGFVFVLGLGLMAMIAVDAWLLVKRVKYNHDVSQLREHMTQAEREKSDVIVQSEQNKLRIAIELAKRQAKFNKKLHLNVSIDSSRMYLAREGAVLREIPVQFGPERSPSEASDTPPAAIPRGERTVADLSDTKITLDGGAQIVSSASTQLASDSTAIPPGSLRISSEDMKAIMPNLNAGMKVYFY